MPRTRRHPAVGTARRGLTGPAGRARRPVTRHPPGPRSRRIAPDDAPIRPNSRRCARPGTSHMRWKRAPRSRALSPHRCMYFVLHVMSSSLAPPAHVLRKRRGWWVFTSTFDFRLSIFDLSSLSPPLNTGTLALHHTKYNSANCDFSLIFTEGNTNYRTYIST